MALALGIEGAHHRAEATYRPKANRMGLWLFILSESFLFAAFIAGRYITAGTGRPEHLNQTLALILTMVLLLSSISAYTAETAIAHDDRRTFTLAMSTTIILALVFFGGVILEWNECLTDFRPHQIGPAGIYGSNFQMLIGLHAFHVLTGGIALGFALYQGRRGHFGSHNYWFVEATVKYWHFVDLAWVVIYPTLYLVGTPFAE